MRWQGVPRRAWLVGIVAAVLLLVTTAIAQSPVAGQEPVERAPAGATRLTDEQLYERFVLLAKEGGEGAGLFEKLGTASREIDWNAAPSTPIVGHVRRLEAGTPGSAQPFYLVREISGKLYVLALPDDPGAFAPGAASPYADLAELVKYKLKFHVRTASLTVGGTPYDFVKLDAPPERDLLDRLFFVAIIVLLFLTMVGMGLTLTGNDFALVFRKPRGMIVGPLCQFLLLPVLGMAFGRLAGFYDTYPFIYLGIILIASSPGGVTSNLMTYFGKGDVALSVSLTAVCTVLALVATPLLLTLFVSNLPAVSIPVGEVFKSMLVLVIVPLGVGMLVRWKSEKTAKRAEKPFALLGVLSLLFLIVVGVWSNLDKFGDTARYGVRFYATVFALTLAGMLAAGLVSKLVGINNYQTRAISLECGLRNASLAMTIAILIQDQIGDFSSSVFFTSAIFGLCMYGAGAISIAAFKRLLPVAPPETATAAAGGAGAAAAPVSPTPEA